MDQFRVYDEIKNIDEMTDFVFRELGFPEVNVQLYPETVKQQIYNARHKYIRYAGGEGYYQDYFMVTFPGGQSEICVKDLRDHQGNLLDVDIDYVYSFNNGGEYSTGDFASMFSPTNMLINSMSGIGGMSMGSGGGGSFGGSGMLLQEYEVAMMYLGDIKRTFGKSFNVRYIPGKKVLKISPTPQVSVTGVLSAFNNQKLDDLYNLQNYRELAVAMAGMAWGKRMRQIKVAMPDGSQIGGDELLSSYKNDYDAVVETIQGESEYFDIIIA